MNMNAGVTKLFTVTISVFFLVHLVSCFWFLTASYEDYDPNTWVVKYNLLDSSDSSQYLASMYWAFQTLTTVGYGDITPGTTTERILSLLWMIFGVGFYSFTIGNLQSIINTIDVKAQELQVKLNTLSGFAKRTKLPEVIVNKIKRFLENNNTNSFSIKDSK